MEERTYLDFDVIIERSGKKYRARVIGSPAGQASGDFGKPFSDLELENFVLKLGQPRQGTRRIDSSMMGTVKQFGEKLFRTVFNDDVYACYLRSMDIATKDNKGLRLRLRIDVPEFHDLPWEFLYNPQLNQFPALSVNTPVVRYFDLPYTTQPLFVKPPLKILAMISSPEEYPPLDVEGEWKKLNESLEPLINRNLVVLERLKQPTLRALQHSLRRDPVHIFHYIGHGKYFERKQDGMLLLEDENGRGKPVSGQFLGTILHDHRSLQLVVLNACEGARTSSDDPYAGVAQTLVQQGIPAVIAMQFEIFDDAALTFGQEFYSAVVDGYPIDAALSEARKAIFSTGNEVEWGTPVLFSRSPDSVLFRRANAVPVDNLVQSKYGQAVPRKNDKEANEKSSLENKNHIDTKQETQENILNKLLTSLYNQATAKISGRDWSTAQSLLEQIQRLSPNFKDVDDLLEIAKEERVRAEKVETMLAQVRIMLQEKNWSQAKRVIQEVLSLSPDNTEALGLQAILETQVAREQDSQMNSLYDQATSKISQQDWSGAQSLLEQIQEFSPNFKDVDTLLESAKEEQARANEVAALLAQVGTLMQESDLPQANQIIQEVLNLVPDNTEALNLKAILETQIALEQVRKLDSLYDQATAKASGGDWSAARILLEEIQESQAEFKDVDVKLEHVKEEQALSEKVKGMLAQTETMIQKKNWSQANQIVQEVLSLVPDNTEAISLKTILEKQIAREQESQLSAQARVKVSSSKQIKPPKPTSFPEEFKPRTNKPKNLPK